MELVPRLTYRCSVIGAVPVDEGTDTAACGGQEDTLKVDWDRAGLNIGCVGFHWIRRPDEELERRYRTRLPGIFSSGDTV